MLSDTKNIMIFLIHKYYKFLCWMLKVNTVPNKMHNSFSKKKNA